MLGAVDPTAEHARRRKEVEQSTTIERADRTAALTLKGHQGGTFLCVRKTTMRRNRRNSTNHNNPPLIYLRNKKGP